MTEKKYEGGMGGLIDRIADRDADDPIGLGKKKEKSEPVKDTPDKVQVKTETKKKKSSGGWTGLMDDIVDREDDDPVGVKKRMKKAKKEKKEEKEEKEETEKEPEKSEKKEEKDEGDDTAKEVGSIVKAGITGAVALGTLGVVGSFFKH